MTQTSGSAPAPVDSLDGVYWPVGALFLDSLAHRDFTTMGACLESDVRMRALTPPGPFDANGATEAMSHFRRWFGGEDAFEVVDASIGQVGSRLYLRWRVRMRSASDPTASRVAEQHAFVTSAELISTLDLLCSGFQPEGSPPL